MLDDNENKIRLAFGFALLMFFAAAMVMTKKEMLDNHYKYIMQSSKGYGFLYIHRTSGHVAIVSPIQPLPWVKFNGLDADVQAAIRYVLANTGPNKEYVVQRRLLVKGDGREK